MNELKIYIPGGEVFNNDTMEFITVKPITLTLKHSLLSLAKWESKWKIPFLEKKPEKTQAQMLDYVRCMTLTKNVDPNAYLLLTQENWSAIKDHIADPMTATWFGEDKNRSRKKEVITNEIIYYWMITENIPIDTCERWHLNRLLTLIRVCSIKNAPPKKMGKSAIMSRNRALNEARKAKYGTRG